MLLSEFIKHLDHTKHYVYMWFKEGEVIVEEEVTHNMLAMEVMDYYDSVDDGYVEVWLR